VRIAPSCPNGARNEIHLGGGDFEKVGEKEIGHRREYWKARRMCGFKTSKTDV
jgi:hypothetical protein